LCNGISWSTWSTKQYIETKHGSEEMKNDTQWSLLLVQGGGDGHSYLDHGDGFQYTTNFNTQLHFTTQQKTNLYTTEICSQQNSPPKWQLRTRCGGHSCRRSMQAFADMLCHVPSMGSCSQFCLILQPHRVAVPFTLIFASPWWHSFVQIHSGTTCFFVKIWDYPSKTTQK